MGELFSLSPICQSLLAGLMTWLLTAAGAALVVLAKGPHPLLLDAMLAFGAGVMLASSYWSLLAPAIDLSGTLGQSPLIIVSTGFFFGGVLLMLCDTLLSRCLPASLAATDSRRRSILLMSSITLHNIPEGLAVGVTFGALATAPSTAALGAAWMLALGIGLQNLPEGAAVSLPLRREGMSRRRAFFFGQASALVEPLAAVFGAVLAVYVRSVLPFSLAFAAGAMVCVVIAELVPESQRHRHSGVMTLFTLLGFILMMILDVALG